MSDQYNFEKLAREIVSSRLQNIKNAPAAAAEIAKRIIVVGVKSTRVRQKPNATVRQVCRGTMGGMMIIGKDLPKAAIEILQALGESAAQKVHVDPNDLMTWAMEGIADVMPMAGLEVRSSIRELIDERFMGAGEVFSGFCDRAAKAS